MVHPSLFPLVCGVSRRIPVALPRPARALRPPPPASNITLSNSYEGLQVDWGTEATPIYTCDAELGTGSVRVSRHEEEEEDSIAQKGSDGQGLSNFFRDLMMFPLSGRRFPLTGNFLRQASYLHNSCTTRGVNAATQTYFGLLAQDSQLHFIEIFPCTVKCPTYHFARSRLRYLVALTRGLPKLSYPLISSQKIAGN